MTSRDRTPRAKRQRAERLGRWAETAAVWLLRAKGYRIVARRARTPSGEIDIVAQRAGLLVAMEVKARNAIDEQLVSTRQQQRILRALEAFVAYRPQFQDYAWRVDMIVVRPWRLPRHVVDAWRDER